MIPMWLPKLLAIAGGIIYVFWSQAKLRSKIVIASLVIGSLILEKFFSSLAMGAVVLVIQVAVGIYVLLYFKVSH